MNTNPTLLGAGKEKYKQAALLSGLSLLALALVFYCYGESRVASYNRIVPLGVTVELTYFNQQEPQTELILEYDQGYGFISAHRQSRIIQSKPDGQTIEFSIPSWKATRALRLKTKRQTGLSLGAASFNRLDSSVRRQLNKSESGIILTLDNVDSIFQETTVSSSLKQVN